MNFNPTSYGNDPQRPGQQPPLPETVYAPNQSGSNPNNYPNYPNYPNPAADPYGAPPPPPGANPYPYPNNAPRGNPYPNNGQPAPANPYPYPNNAPPANQYQYPGSVPPPAYNVPPPMGTMPPVGTPPAGSPSAGGKVVLIILAALVVLGGLVAVIGISAHNSQVAADNTHATATAQVNSTSTALAQTNATATAVAVASTFPFSTNLKLNDPLTDNSKGMGWITDKGCVFSADGYHATENAANTYYTCPAMKSSFSDFSYQVTMNITQGDLAGISFRGNDNQQSYYTFVFRKSDGMYWLLVYPQKGAKSQTLYSNTTSYFNGSQSNQLGVTVRGSKISLYVNGHELTSVADSTFSSGQIGTIVYNGQNQGDTVEAVFSNAKVWQL